MTLQRHSVFKLSHQNGSVYVTLGYIDNAFTIWGFIVLDQLSIYCNVRVTKFIKEKARKEGLCEYTMTTPEQAQDLIGHLNALRFYSYAKVAIDVVALALSFIPFLTNSKWKALVNVGGCVFVFHGITYSCLLSRIVLVAFPQSRAVNLSGVARENQRKKSPRGNLSKGVVGKMFGRRESDLKAG